MAQYTQIRGLSERRRLPRLGTIRGGIKVHKAGCKCGQPTGTPQCTYPKETSHIVLPLELQKLFGPTPTEIEVMLPPVERAEVCHQSYRCYGSSRGLKCTGDGQTATRLVPTTGEWADRECPGPQDQGEGADPLCVACKPRGFLFVMVPKHSMGGVYQVGTGSVNSIIDVNSYLDYLIGLVGRWQLVPLILKRTKIETHHDGKKQFHYPFQLELRADVTTTNALRENTKRILSGPVMALPPAQEEGPAADVFDAEVTAEPEPNGGNGKAESDGEPLTPPPPATADPDPLVSSLSLDERETACEAIWKLAETAGKNKGEVRSLIHKTYKVTSLDALRMSQLRELGNRISLRRT